MTHIEKLFDILINTKSDKLVLRLNDPPYVLKGSDRTLITKSALVEKTFLVFKSEWEELFQSKETFTYNTMTFKAQVSDQSMEFSLIPGARQDFPDIPSEDMPSEEAPDEKISELTVQFLNDQTIHNLMRLMVAKNASDLHLSSRCQPMIRLDGDMIILEDLPEVMEEWLWTELRKITPDRNVSEFERCNDTDFAYELEGVARFRTNISRDQRGLCTVMRQIPSKIVPVDILKIPQPVLNLCNMPKGLVLVTGPTGSGKSTTLAALIDHINSTQPCHIVTIEDPVEFIHPNKLSLVNQREVNTHTESFKRALRAALREDPDVILVGEMRDLETIAIAIEMAVTGHLVFGTLHTATACGTIDRIIDQFPTDQQEQIRTMLADSLIGVISQVLCKRKHGGRVAAYEVLIGTVAISNLIREGKTFQIPSLMQTGKSIGMKMMADSLAELAESGLVNAEEALANAVEKDALKSRLKIKGLAK